MANITITNNKTRRVELFDPIFEDDTVTFAGAATWEAGTILARDSGSGFLVPFVKGGSTNENGIPKAVLTEAVTATGAGNLPARPMVGGEVRAGDLIILADGNASNVDAELLDQLRDYGITGRSTTQLAELDNQ